MSRKRSLLAAALLSTLTVAYSVGVVSGQSVATQTKQNDHQAPERTIPAAFGRVVGAIPGDGDQFSHSLVMEAADGTIRLVPLNRANSIRVFARQ